MAAPCPKNVELLAPAGNMECLHAAVKAGADAVYLGAGHFNARRGADNFSLENLAEACDYAHLRGVKIYLTLNTVVLPSELPDALELARQAYRCGVDAFIVQDIGISIELSRIMPDVEVHVSTQMNIHDEDGLRAAAALGATRVTLARELSLAEIARLHELAEELGVELESFAHGALCICYSGQCFMSSLVGGRSANRGRCAQACRLPYELHNRALRKTLDAPGEHLLSPKDLCTANLIPELLHAGVASLKIEGRMKSPESVQAVVGVYRAVIDRVEAAIDRDGIDSVVASDAPELRASEEEMNVLSEAFSRGFTTAYLKGKRGNEIMSYGRPNNRGVFVGRVAKVREGLVFIDPETELHVGDLIEFWTNRGHFVHTIGEFKTDRAGRVFFPVERAVGKGDRVFRVRNAEAAFVDDDKLPSVAVCARAELRIGQPALLTFTVAAGDASVTVEGPEVEAARTKAITEKEVREHIDRMGTTPFYLSSLEIDLDEGVGMGFSMLHKLRARAAEELQEAILAHYHARKLERTPSRAFAPVVRRGWCKVAALATNPACARAAKRAGADLIYVPAANYRRGEAVIAGQLSDTAEQAGYPKQCIPVLPTVSQMFDEEKRNGFDTWKRVKADKPVMVENLGQLLHATEMGAAPEVGPHIPVTNKLDLQAMADLGAQRVWLSPELSLVQIEELGDMAPMPLGLTIMGQTELMVTEHCLLMSQGPCNQKCAECARRKSPHYLKDRKGYEMPVITDCTGRSHLYNAVQMDVAHLMPEIIGAGVSTVLVDTTLMNVKETTEKVARAVRARDIAQKDGNKVAKAEGATSGHLFRGVS
ncbi:MAG: peptidase U32 [Eggerthella sp. 51_9]|nr:MAG: peptidase U32 [Eggerthella sp. 51_9]